MSSIARFRILLVSIAVLVTMGGFSSVAAARSTSASGTFVTTSVTFNSSRPSGTAMIHDLTATLTYTGAFSGTSVLRGDLTIRADGSAHLVGSETFTGTVDGVSGTVTWTLILGSTSTGAYYAVAIIRNGTGDLSNLRGGFVQVGEVHGQGPYGTYTGKVR